MGNEKNNIATLPHRGWVLVKAAPTGQRQYKENEVTGQRESDPKPGQVSEKIPLDFNGFGIRLCTVHVY